MASNVRWFLLMVTLGAFQVSPSHSFFESIMNALTRSKEAFQDAMPYVVDLYGKVKRAQEIADSLIDEECHFSCPRGRVAVPRDGHVKTSNGCGALNVIFDHTDESPVRLDKSKFLHRDFSRTVIHAQASTKAPASKKDKLVVGAFCTYVRCIRTDVPRQQK